MGTTTTKSYFLIAIVIPFDEREPHICVPLLMWRCVGPGRKSGGANDADDDDVDTTALLESVATATPKSRQ